MMVHVNPARVSGRRKLCGVGGFAEGC